MNEENEKLDFCGGVVSSFIAEIHLRTKDTFKGAKSEKLSEYLKPLFDKIANSLISLDMSYFDKRTNEDDFVTLTFKYNFNKLKYVIKGVNMINENINIEILEENDGECKETCLVMRKGINDIILKNLKTSNFNIKTIICHYPLP